MADLSKIKLNGIEYDLKDNIARTLIVPIDIDTTTRPAQFQSNEVTFQEAVNAYLNGRQIILRARNNDGSLKIGGEDAYVCNYFDSTLEAATLNNDGGNTRIYWNEEEIQTAYIQTFDGNYNMLYNTPSLATVATSGSYNDLINTPTIPNVPSWALESTKPTYTAAEVGAVSTSDLNNYVKKEETSSVGNSTSISTRFSRNFSSIILTASPYQGYSASIAISSGELDSGSSSVNINASQTTIRGVVTPTSDTMAANKKYVDNKITADIATAIGNINQFNVAIVSTLPTTNIDNHTIYFKANGEAGNNIYDEYMYINNNWEIIGSTAIDLSGYLQTSDIADWAKAANKPTYTANEVGALPDTTVIPTVPSNISAFTNDVGYISSFNETDPVFTASAAAGISSTDISNWNAKSDFSGSYNDLTDQPTIPTNVSAFNNDAGYLTSYTETDPTVPAWAKAATKPSYTAAEVGALPDTTVIPAAQVNADWDATSGVAQILHKPSIPNVPAWALAASKPSYTATEVGALPDTYTAPVTSVNGQTGDVTLTIPAAQVQSDWNATSGMGVILNKPTIPAATTITNTLASGTLIAIINGTNIYAPAYTDADGVSY